MTAAEIIKQKLQDSDVVTAPFSLLADLMEEYGREQWNAALEEAAENVTVDTGFDYCRVCDRELSIDRIDTQSILKLKK
jgi:hypothetical protein